MKKLEDFKGSLFTKEAMKKTKGGLMAPTKTNCDGTTTNLPDGTKHQDCPDDDGPD